MTPQETIFSHTLSNGKKAFACDENCLRDDVVANVVEERNDIFDLLEKVKPRGF